MTSPAGATAGIASINADISAVQARIASIAASVGAPVGTASSASSNSSASASQFATALADASPTSGGSAVAGTSGVNGSAVVADAEKYLGVPYVWGGESNSGLDCSGLVQKTFKDLGIDVPRIASDQQKVGQAVPSLKDAQPGDLLFFGQPAYHVAIYMGNNKLIESPEPGKTVHITDVYQQPTSIRRIVPSASALAAAGPTPAGGLSSGQLTAAGLNRSVAAYATQFAAAESQFNLPTGMLAAVAQQESGGNPHAVSPAGAEGLMQLMPSTAAGMNVNALDPSQAIEAAAKILHNNLKQFGNSVPLALAAYNAGAGAVQQYGGIPPYSETQNYVRNITSMMRAGA
ncbi:MAG TPA: transglycosylase SLT domain-containing protein [Jatrophihabitantaceae bacterium]|nr:transglycosylase SLT domain-containing protein [Jatrophihabitantaceae bacterium]